MGNRRNDLSINPTALHYRIPAYDFPVALDPTCHRYRHVTTTFRARPVTRLDCSNRLHRVPALSMALRRVDPEPLGHLLLGEPQLQTPFPDMLADCTRLKIRFLWFQCLKRDGQAWQKGNASSGLADCVAVNYGRRSA